MYRKCLLRCSNSLNLLVAEEQVPLHTRPSAGELDRYRQYVPTNQICQSQNPLAAMRLNQTLTSSVSPPEVLRGRQRAF